MSISTAGIPGPFCWIELAASDAERATAFYGELFGWPAHRQRIGPVPMVRLTRDGGPTSARSIRSAVRQRAAGVPPHWTPYVAGADLEAAGVVRPR